MRAILTNITKIIGVFTIIFCFCAYNPEVRSIILKGVDQTMAKKGYLNIIDKSAKLPRIYPDKCLRVEYSLPNDITTSWITCLKKNDLISFYFDHGEGWEPTHVRCLANILRKNPNAAYLDVGSNIGPHVCMAAKFAKRIYALDPSKENLSYIRTSLKLEGTDDKAVLFNNAVSNTNVELFPFQPDSFNQGATLYLRKDELVKMKQKNFAKGKSLWSITFQEIIDVIPHKTIILKIDVEGTECKVLSEYLGKNNKEKNIPYILMEWKVIQQNAENLCPDLEAFTQLLLKADYSPMTVGELSSIKQLRIHDLKREAKEIVDVLWVHKSVLF